MYMLLLVFLMALFELNVCIRQYVGLYSLKSTKGVKKITNLDIKR